MLIYKQRQWYRRTLTDTHYTKKYKKKKCQWWQTLRIIRIILTTIIVESLRFYPFLKQKSRRGGSFSPADGTANFLKLFLQRIRSTINENYKTVFFFFILGAGTHGAPRGISGDPVLVRMRVVRLLLQAVTSECLRKRGKKRERARERAREGGWEGGREWMRVGEGGCCCRLKKQRCCSELSHRKVWGSGGDAGESCLTPAPRVSLARSSEQRSPLRIRPRQSNGRPLHRPAPSSAHTPQGPALLCTPPPPPLLFLLCSFSPEKKKKKKTFLLCSLKSFLDFSELPEG